MSKDISPKPGKAIDLNDYDPSSTRGLPDKDAAETLTEAHCRKVGEFQNRLYANGDRALLVILQGMDASGKDGAVRKVFDHVNPAGVEVTSFKAPTEEERRHDFLWRVHQKVPPLGKLGVFNRSHYEDVLVVRVHADRMLPEYLRGQKDIWKMRFHLIRDFESQLTRTGVKVLKFFLHISKEEQAARFRDRQHDPDKHYKLSLPDLAERKHWDEYQRVYEKAIEHTNTEEARWYIVPANHKWVRNFHIAKVVHDALADMKLKPRPAEDPAVLKVKIR